MDPPTTGVSSKPTEGNEILDSLKTVCGQVLREIGF
jgi:hypothetical protein